MIINKIYISGSHRLAFMYFKKLLAAQQKQTISFNQIFLVGAESCQEASEQFPSSWLKMSPSELLSQDPAFFQPHDILVPDHTAPHLLLQTLLQIIQKQRPDIIATLNPMSTSFNTPFVKDLQNQSLYALSYATWTCPLECEEPVICPHTQQKREWSFENSLPKMINTADSSQHYQFFCQQLIEGLSFIPIDKILQTITHLLDTLRQSPQQTITVSTHSHCHGIIGQFCTKVQSI